MNITTCTDQAECGKVLDELQIREALRPLPPNIACDCLMKLDATSFLVGSNNAGNYTLHLLEDSTQAEAGEFFDALRAGSKSSNPRLHFVGAGAASSN